MYNPKSNRRNERSGEVEKYFFHQNGVTCYHHKFISTIFLPVFINDDNSGITGVPRNIIILQFSIYIIWPTKKWNNDGNNVKIIHVFVTAWKQKVSKCIPFNRRFRWSSPSISLPRISLLWGSKRSGTASTVTNSNILFVRFNICCT